MSHTPPPTPGGPRALLLVGAVTAVVLLTVVLRTAGAGQALALIGLGVTGVGVLALLGRAPWAGLPTRRAAATLAGAGLAVLTVGAALAPPVENTAPTASSAPVSSGPDTTTPKPSPAAQPIVARPTAVVAAVPTVPRPPAVLTLDCPAGGAAAVFGAVTSAVPAYSVTIDYGDGEQYTNDDQHLAAVFSHGYATPGSYLVTAALTDTAGQVVSASCTYTWVAASQQAAVDVDQDTGAPAVQEEPAAPVEDSAPVVEDEPSYANCDDVRAHGAAPIHPGDPGFRDQFDRDHDGVGCE